MKSSTKSTAKPASATPRPRKAQQATPQRSRSGKTAAVRVPRQRPAPTKAVPAPAKVSAEPPATAPAPAPEPRPRRSRPLIKSVRRNDGRALSYSERLSEAMHTRLRHSGPVCHVCRTNASRLAALSLAPSPLSI